MNINLDFAVKISTVVFHIKFLSYINTLRSLANVTTLKRHCISHIAFTSQQYSTWACYDTHTLRKKECHANWCSDAAMIEEPERSFVPGTSVYLIDSTDDTQTCSPANETLQQSHAK